MVVERLFQYSNQAGDNCSLPVNDHCNYYLQILLLVDTMVELSADLTLVALEERAN